MTKGQNWKKTKWQTNAEGSKETRPCLITSIRASSSEMSEERSLNRQSSWMLSKPTGQTLPLSILGNSPVIKSVIRSLKCNQVFVMTIRFVISSVIRPLANRSWLKSFRMLFKPTSQTLPLSILQETAELVVPVPSFAQTTNQQPAWLFGNGFKINSKVGGSPTEGWSKRGQCRQVEIDEVCRTFFKACQSFLTF